MPNLAAKLERLRRSEVFASDFPQRMQMTHADMWLLSEDELESLHRPGANAFERVKDPHQLAELARDLGNARYQPAIATLAEIWHSCALDPLRIAAGHALRTIATPEARQALIAMIEDADHLSVYLAVRAIFDEDPMAAYDRFISYFDPERVGQPGGVVIPTHALHTFAPSTFSHEGPEWSEPRAPKWLLEDRRWLELCIRLRRDDVLGGPARDVLRHVDPGLLNSLLDAAVEQEGPRVVHFATKGVGDLAVRYRAGEYEEVWRTLRGFKAINGDLRVEANEVAKETMQRVAHNLDLLASRLAERGWQALSGAFRSAFGKEDAEMLATIESIVGASLPPSLAQFWRIAGGVDLIWNYDLDEPPPQLISGALIEFAELDPLCIYPASDSKWQLEDWEAEYEKCHPELIDPIELYLSPDFYHKANYSGGAPYGVVLPFHGADPLIENESHELPLVDYLRHCLRWGSFARLERRADESGVTDFVAAMTKDFEPF